MPPLAPWRPSQMPDSSYPRPDSPLYLVPQPEVRRGSTGSDCSMPGMIEDQGSDISTEDEYQSHATGTDLWDSFWQARVHEELSGGRLHYPALLDTRTSHHEQPLIAGQEVQQTVRARAGSQTSQESTWPLPLTISPTKRQTKETPRASYSLFPTKNGSPPVQPTTPPRRTSLPKNSSEMGSHPSDTPTKTTKTNNVEAGPKTHTEPPPAPRVILRPLPATPRPQRTTMSTASALTMKPLPRIPDQRRRSARRTSGANQHRRSISKTPTQSLPTLSSTMQRRTALPQHKLQHSQSQTFQVSPVLPIEAERQPQPPQVSVFEFSDDEDDDDSSNRGGLARRLVRGLTQHRDRNGTAKARLTSHQRSVSHNPSAPTSNISKTGSTWALQERTGTPGPVGIAGGNRTSSVSEVASSDGPRQRAKTGRSRPWLSRQSSELFFGRILGRRGS